VTEFWAALGGTAVLLLIVAFFLVRWINSREAFEKEMREVVIPKMVTKELCEETSGEIETSLSGGDAVFEELKEDLRFLIQGQAVTTQFLLSVCPENQRGEMPYRDMCEYKRRLNDRLFGPAHQKEKC